LNKSELAWEEFCSCSSQGQYSFTAETQRKAEGTAQRRHNQRQQAEGEKRKAKSEKRKGHEDHEEDLLKQKENHGQQCCEAEL